MIAKTSLGIAAAAFLLRASPPAGPPPGEPWLPEAPPLPPPEGEAIRVATVEELFAAVERVRPGGAILVEDGRYFLPRYLEIRTDRVTLRGASGRRERAILDGARSRDGELLGLRGCSGVRIADLTVQNVRSNGIKLNTDANVQRVSIYNCAVHNVWQRGVKGVKVPRDRLEELRPRDCRIEYCLFSNDRPKRFEDDPADTPENFGGNYVGGIDVMFAQGWVVRDNVFAGIQGRTREARGAIFFWHDSRDCTIERNVVIDCDVGIALGNSYRPEDIAVHCTDFVVRDNFIVRAPESGIVSAWTKGCRILQNTIYDPENRLGRLIRVVHDAEGLRIAGNFLFGPPARIETESRIELRGNLVLGADAARSPAPRK